MANELVVRLIGDTKDLERALARAKKSGDGFQKGLEKASKGAAIALGALGVGAALSVKAASNLEEQINKTAVVFRGSEDAIHAWAQTTAESFGISQRAALEAAGTFGNMLVPMGIARDRAGEMSTKFVELAADMASFNNASPEETLDALRAGLAGETEPLRRFGVFLNAARIKQEALRLGLVKGKEELTASAKAQATYSIILKDTGDAQGDFARTSDSLANQQRILRAELEDTAAELGNALLPAATAAAGVLLDLVQVIGDNEDAAKALVIAAAALSGGILLLNASTRIYTSSTLAAIGATKGLRIAMAATPWGLAAVAAAGLVAFIISQGDESEEASVAQRKLTDAVNDYNQAIKDGNNARKDYQAASRRVEAAEIGLARAQQARRDLLKDDNATLLDRRDANLRVAEAMAELRDAEDQAVKSGTQLRDSDLRQIGSQRRQRASVEDLAKEFRDNLVKSQEVYRKGAGQTRVVTGRVSEATAEGRRNAEAYADKLRAMAQTMQDSQPKLADTARLAARLADAWGRVVSLPAAREFVAKFTVISRVEETRTIPTGRATGGPVTAGAPYIVGEYRPEIFVPSESGRILPRVPQAAGATAGPGGTYMVLADGQFISWLRSLDTRERRRNGGKGIL